MAIRSSKQFFKNFYSTIDASIRGFAVAFVTYVSDTYSNYVVALIGSDSITNLTNKTFVDSSTNNFTITPTGTPSHGSFSNITDRSSMYFNGSTDYLQVATNTVFDFGTGPFTIEAWIFPLAVGAVASPNNIFQIGYHASGNKFIEIGIQLNVSTYQVYGNIYNGTTYKLQALANGVLLGKWNHISFVWDGSFGYVSINGVLGTKVSGTLISSDIVTSGAVYAGYYYSTTSYYYNGYISNLRVVKGTALYSANFIPATTKLTNIINTSVLLNNVNFNDYSSNGLTVTVNGTPKIEKFSPFAPSYTDILLDGSYHFNGSTDYLTIPSNAAFNLSSIDWTIECWFYTTNIPANSTHLIQSLTGTNGWVAYVAIGLNTNKTFNCSINAVQYSSTQTINLNCWNHVAMVRNSGVVKVYLNGVATSISVTADIPSTNLGFWIGKVDNSPGAGSYIYYYNGYMSDLRIVKGTAVYTANFTPPTTKLTNITNTSLLINVNNPGSYDLVNCENLRFTGNATTNNAITKYGTGSIYLPDQSTDSVNFTSPNSKFLFPADFTVEGWNRSVSGGDGSIFIVSNGTNYFGINSTTTLMNIYLNSLTPTFSTLSSSIIPNTWQHLALARTGSLLSLYIDGTYMTGSVNSSALGYSSPSFCRIGGGVAGARYIDDLRITNGVCRYPDFLTSVNSPTVTGSYSINTQIYTAYVFTGSSGTFYIPTTTTVEYLVVAGGGGGGNSPGGGGGGGGLLSGSVTLIGGNTYTVTVGSGGSGSLSSGIQGSNGANSVISGTGIATITAIGGGGGGSSNGSPPPYNPTGVAGGSGGGSMSGAAAGTGTSGQGNTGGVGIGQANWGGGGGGGAGAVGGNASTTNGGNGGIGKQLSITGTPTYYAGGGGGGCNTGGSAGGTGGLGGGGNGALGTGTATAGTPNTGGGGAGGAAGAVLATDGGSGVVIIKIPTPFVPPLQLI